MTLWCINVLIRRRCAVWEGHVIGFAPEADFDRDHHGANLNKLKCQWKWLQLFVTKWSSVEWVTVHAHFFMILNNHPQICAFFITVVKTHALSNTLSHGAHISNSSKQLVSFLTPFSFVSCPLLLYYEIKLKNKQINVFISPKAVLDKVKLTEWILFKQNTTLWYLFAYL